MEEQHYWFSFKNMPSCTAWGLIRTDWGKKSFWSTWLEMSPLTAFVKCLVLDGINLNTVHKLSIKEKLQSRDFNLGLMGEKSKHHLWAKLPHPPKPPTPAWKWVECSQLANLSQFESFSTLDARCIRKIHYIAIKLFTQNNLYCFPLSPRGITLGILVAFYKQFIN